MHPLPPFRCSDPAKLARVIEEYPLATLVAGAGEWPACAQAPLVLERGQPWLLRGHLDANNAFCAHLAGGSPVLALFHGPNHYITPSIYPDSQYPGWNYVTVQARCRARPVADPERVRASLLELGKRHEPPDSGYELRPTQRNFALYQTMVYGFELLVEDLRGVFKLAQDKGPAHAQRARAHLSERVRERAVDAFLGDLLA